MLFEINETSKDSLSPRQRKHSIRAATSQALFEPQRVPTNPTAATTEIHQVAQSQKIKPPTNKARVVKRQDRSLDSLKSGLHAAQVGKALGIVNVSELS